MTTTHTSTACRLILTRHAIERFKERFCRLANSRLTDPEATIRRLLKRTVLEQISPKERVRRLINNGFHDCWYMAADGWRFVCVAKDGNVVIVTIERRKPWQN